MKILKGYLKGRNIASPSRIRPVTLKVRKACFDILGGEISEKKVLDLFAGSGALGIEALSSGAKTAVFIDIRKRCAEAIKVNLRSLKLIPKAQIHLKDAFRKVKDLHEKGETFDIIFLDPPYYKGLVKKSLQTLEEYDIVAPSGYIVCFCSARDEYVKEGKGFGLVAIKKYGQTSLLIYRRQI